MPETPIYGFPFEHPVDDEPGHTLDGGSLGTEPILAQEVEDELERIDGGITDLQTALAGLIDSDTDFSDTLVEIEDSDGQVDLGVEATVTVGPLGVVIVTQFVRWQAVTGADTRALTLRLIRSGANSGVDLIEQERAVTARQAGGTQRTVTTVFVGQTAGSTTFTHTAQMSTDDLNVVENRITVVAF